MKKHAGTASCLIAAVAAVSFGYAARAADLIYNNSSSAPATPDAVVDADPGGSPWDHSTPSWYNQLTNMQTTFTDGDNVQFGNSTNAATGSSSFPVVYIADTGITVGNIQFGLAANGTTYVLASGGGSSTPLTLNGGITKITGFGGPILDASLTVNLASGSLHQISLKDTGGDKPEMVVNGHFTGSGGLLFNNAGYESWGTTDLNSDNDYTGETQISRGRVVITTGGALGSTSAGTTISDAGSLSLFGAGTQSAFGGISVSEPITITRNTYTGGDAVDGGLYSHYQYAILSANGSGTNNLNGPLNINSTDARVRVETSTLNINGPVTAQAANTPLVLDGDFAGFVNLNGNQTGLAAAGIRIIGGVEVNIANDNNYGGTAAPIDMEGGTLRFVNGYATSFGGRNFNYSTFNGGLDIAAGETFTVDVPLGQTANAVGTFGKRGTGTLNINASINLRGGQTYWDGGIVNVNAPVTFANLHLRSPTVNIGTGGSITTTAGYNSFGQDTTGTNGGPDIAVINLTGTGALTQTSGDDFNISDNARTQGTFNLSDSSTVTTVGTTYVGKNAGAKGVINIHDNATLTTAAIVNVGYNTDVAYDSANPTTTGTNSPTGGVITQSGGTFNSNRSGNFSLVIGRDAGVGSYTKTGGTLNVSGEMYVGQGVGSINNVATSSMGTFTQSGGTTTVNNWFVVGREGGEGNVTISNGSVFNKTGAGNFQIDAGGTLNTPSTFTVDNATLNINGELQVGTDTAAANGTLTVKNGGQVNTNNWFSVGRSGATGTLNLDGGTITKTGPNNTYVGEGAAQGSVINVDGGNLNLTTGELWLGNAGSSKGTVNLSSGSITVNNWIAVGRNGTASGDFEMTGGTLTKNANGTSRFVIGSGGTASGVLNQSGGAIVSNLTSVGESGTGTATLSGGTASLGGLIVNDSGPAGTLTIKGSAAVSATSVVMGNSGSGTSTFNLNGGSFTASSIATGNSTGTKTFSWTGGNLTTGSFAVGSGLNNAGTGTLLPGGDNAAGETDITGGYTQASTATLDVDIAGDVQRDWILVTNNTVLDGSVNVDVLGNFDPAYHSFRTLLVTNGTLTLGSSFALTGPDASEFTYSVVNGNSLVLTAIVPEPSSLAVVGIGAAAMLRRKRRV